ncbi:type VII secretion protein EccCb [Streptomyces sp. SBR177]
MVGQMEGAAEPVRRIWLPPLPAAITLDQVAGPLDVGPRGMRLTERRGPLHVPLGLLDDPAKQWQGAWYLDLTVAGGHVAVIGGPQSGKTTLLRTLVLSLALTHTPQEVGVYGLDLVGGGLQALADLPHVGGVASRADRERAARTVEEVRNMLAAREDLFRDHNIDSVDQLRTLHAAGRLPQLASAEIVLVIDGFGALRDDFDELDDAVVDILKRGSGYGIHVVAGMLRWNDVRIAAQSNFGTRVELRLNDPSESSIDRKLAETLVPDEPGRVLTDGKLFAQAALPRTDGEAGTSELGAVLERTAKAIRATWSGEVAQPVRVLPHVLEPRLLPGPVAEPRRVPIGLDQTALEPVLLDLFHHDQHLLVMGDSECGKTNLLRTVAAGLVERYGEDDLVFAVMDPRRGLRGAIPEEYLGGYAYNARLSEALSVGIAGELEKRLPDEGADPRDLEPGSWGSGPRIVVLIDDYDVLTTAGQAPLAPSCRTSPRPSTSASTSF